MTREDAKAILKDCWYKAEYKHGAYGIALEMAIKALEPCEDWYDVPSNEMTLEQARQAVKDLRKRFKEDLEQEPKTGHWWERDTYPQECECWDCSECQETVFERTNYCPNCGARMEESEEKG